MIFNSELKIIALVEQLFNNMIKTATFHKEANINISEIDSMYKIKKKTKKMKLNLSSIIFQFLQYSKTYSLFF